MRLARCTLLPLLLSPVHGMVDSVTASKLIVVTGANSGASKFGGLCADFFTLQNKDQQRQPQECWWIRGVACSCFGLPDSRDRGQQGYRGVGREYCCCLAACCVECCLNVCVNSSTWYFCVSGISKMNQDFGLILARLEIRISTGIRSYHMI